LDPCGAKINGALRDLASGQTTVDGRTLNLDVGGDGWGKSSDEDISSFANISACPNNWSKTDIDGPGYELAVTVTDRDKRKATKARRAILGRWGKGDVSTITP